MSLHTKRSPLTTSGPSAFRPRRSVACERRRPTHSKRRHCAVDLVDHGQKVVCLQAVAPMNLVHPDGFDPAQFAVRQAPLQQTIPPTDRPLPNWSGRRAPFLANSAVAPSAPGNPSWRRSPDACRRSRECARRRPRVRRTPPAVARSRNRSGFPTAAQTASAAAPGGHSPALAAGSANSARVFRHVARC